MGAFRAQQLWQRQPPDHNGHVSRVRDVILESLGTFPASEVESSNCYALVISALKSDRGNGWLDG